METSGNNSPTSTTNSQTYNMSSNYHSLKDLSLNQSECPKQALVPNKSDYSEYTYPIKMIGTNSLHNLPSLENH